MIKKRESILFFAATYLLTALAWGTLILLNKPATSSVVTTILYLLGGLSPTIIALLIPLLSVKDARKAYYKRYFNFKISYKWYLIPIAVALLMFLAGFAARLFVSKPVETSSLLPWYMIFPLFVSMIFGGGLEEIGWRGVLVHNLKERNRILTALGIGVIWACWHIPLFFIQGVGQYQASFLPFFVQVIGLSFITSVLYLRARSVVPCILFHALMNAFSGMGSLAGSDPTSSWIAGTIKLAIAAAFFFAFNKRTEECAQ